LALFDIEVVSPASQIPVASDRASASSISTPRYRTVLSIFMTEQDLHGSQVAGLLVDDRRLGPP
jgi:hypothetical protein